MEGLARHHRKGVVRKRPQARLELAYARLAAAVDRITEDRVADVVAVDADLVGASSTQ
jgi:hypothetical protein